MFRGSLVLILSGSRGVAINLGSVELLSRPQPPPIEATFFDDLIARSDVVTAAEFRTDGDAQTRRFRSWPDQALVGEVLNEYIATNAHVEIPVVSGFELRETSHGGIDGCHVNTRQRTGDNTARCGINANHRSWSDWDIQCADAGIFSLP